MSCVTCHVSRVTCHVSPVTCHLSKNYFFDILIYIFFYVKKMGQSGGAGRWRVCYQRGLPRLVYLINWLSQSSFSSKSSKHHKSQTIRAGDLKFWHNVHHLSHVMFHVPCVICHVSPVTCHVSQVTCTKTKTNIIYIFCFFFYKLVELVVGRLVINGAYPVQLLSKSTIPLIW